MSITPESVIENTLKVLNEAVVADRHAITLLCDNRLAASPELCDHPTIVVNESRQIGMVGLINGFLEEITGKRIQAVYEDEDDISWVVRFEEHKPL